MYSNQISYILQPNKFAKKTTYLCIITNLVMYNNQLY